MPKTIMPINLEGPLGMTFTIKGQRVQQMMEEANAKLTADNIAHLLIDMGSPEAPARVCASAIKDFFSRWVQE
jgi:hypothetical protein